MALNFLLWPVFFGANRVGLCLVLVALAAMLAFIAATWNKDRLAVILSCLTA